VVFPVGAALCGRPAPQGTHAGVPLQRRPSSDFDEALTPGPSPWQGEGNTDVQQSSPSSPGGCCGVGRERRVGEVRAGRRGDRGAAETS
jgi:hypothetical protein